MKRSNHAPADPNFPFWAKKGKFENTVLESDADNGNEC